MDTLLEKRVSNPGRKIFPSHADFLERKYKKASKRAVQTARTNNTTAAVPGRKLDDCLEAGGGHAILCSSSRCLLWALASFAFTDFC